MQLSRYNRRHGFTLAELLLALAILGIIAAFTVPKVLTASNTGKKVAIFKDTISAINGAITADLQEGGPSTQGQYYTGINNRLQLVCKGGFGTCWNATAQGTPLVIAPLPWSADMSFHNGAIATIANNGSGGMWFVIDYNGIAAPNVMGDDQLYLGMCYTQSNGSNNCGYWIDDSVGVPLKPGIIGPAGYYLTYYSTANQNLYFLVFNK